MARRRQSLQWWTSVALVVLASLMAAALTVQGYSSQALVEHRIWREVLESVSDTYIAQHGRDPSTTAPDGSVLHAWLVTGHAIPVGMPPYLRALAPGYHSSEGDDAVDAGGARFHALVTPMDGGRLVAVLDIGAFEGQQNRDAAIHATWGIVLMLLIGGLIVWLHMNLVRPVKDLARHILAIEPAIRGQRIPETYRQRELWDIARASNAHLERVERFMARERSLLEQASHEFRTPVAVISGAADVLTQQGLPEAAQPVLRRISGAVETLSETMVALLYLSREANAAEVQDVVALHALLPKLVADHEHLALQRETDICVGELEPTFIAAPESMVRIAVGNLIRNAIENTPDGRVEISLHAAVVSVSDSGSGFDPAEAARRYRESFRSAAPAWGQGLGLFLISRICERFRWDLKIESKSGEGTRARLDMRASVINEEV